MSAPVVTVVCATRNARAAVRLTVASLLRHTHMPFRFLIADNGSNDGTLEDLKEVPGVKVVALPERRAAMNRHAAWQRQVLAGLDRRQRRFRADGDEKVRAVLDAGRVALGGKRPVVEEDSTVTLHGTTLDWLCEQVTTPFTVTLDSDVEILDRRWLPEMLGLMEREQLVALGPYESGQGAYQARLAPHLLVLRTAQIRSLATSFLGGTTTADPEERRRWQQRRRSFAVDLAALADYPTTKVYPTGAVLFQELVRRGMRWRPMPAGLTATFHHFGHQSWGGIDDAEGGDGAVRADHARLAREVAERWSAFGRRWPPDAGRARA